MSIEMMVVMMIDLIVIVIELMKYVLKDVVI